MFCQKLEISVIVMTRLFVLCSPFDSDIVSCSCISAMKSKILIHRYHIFLNNVRGH